MRERKTANKMLVTFDSGESLRRDNRALSALAATSGQTKGAIIQEAIESKLIPHTPVVLKIFRCYTDGAESFLSLMADFFRAVASDIRRGMPRGNTEPIIQGLRTYLARYCAKEQVELDDGLWPKERISILCLDWERYVASAFTYDEVADVLATLDAAPEAKYCHLPAEDEFIYPFLLLLDRVVEEWDDSVAMHRYRNGTLQIPLRGGDVLLVPRSPDYVLLNATDVNRFCNAVVLEVANRGALDIPHFVYLTDKTARMLSESDREIIFSAAGAIYPDFNVALEQHVELVPDGHGGYANVEEHLASSSPRLYTVMDDAVVVPDGVLSCEVRIVRRGRRQYAREEPKGGGACRHTEEELPA